MRSQGGNSNFNVNYFSFDINGNNFFTGDNAGPTQMQNQFVNNCYQINEHNSKKRVKDFLHSLNVSSHNNKIQVANSVNNIIISGHNSEIFGPDEGVQSSQGHVILNMIIQGHNNRISNLVIQNLQIKGHNNFLKGVKITNLINNGMNNKFTQCQTEREDGQTQNNRNTRPHDQGFHSYTTTTTSSSTKVNNDVQKNNDWVDENDEQEEELKNDGRQYEEEKKQSHHGNQQSRHQQHSTTHNFTSHHTNHSHQQSQHNSNNHHRQHQQQNQQHQHGQNPNIKFNINTKVFVNSPNGSTFTQNQGFPNMPDINEQLKNLNVDNIGQIFMNQFMPGFQNLMNFSQTTNPNMGMGENPPPGFNADFFSNQFQQQNRNNFDNGEDDCSESSDSDDSSSDSDEDMNHQQQEEEEEGDYEEDGQQNEYGDEGEEGEEGAQYYEEEEEEEIPEHIKIAVINSIAEFQFVKQIENEDASCAICQDNIVAGDKYKKLQCKHKFHSKCLNKWLLQKLQCPLCKLDLYQLQL